MTNDVVDIVLVSALDMVNKGEYSHCCEAHKHFAQLSHISTTADTRRSVLSSKHLDRTNAVIQLEAQRGSETIACSRDDDDEED